MSDKQLDKLFRDKLHGMTHEPSGDAWASVQGQMANKRGAWFYMRIAAAILLLITFVSLYFLNYDVTSAPDSHIAVNGPSGVDYPADTAKVDTDTAEVVNEVVTPVEPNKNNIAEVDTAEVNSKKQIKPQIKQSVATNDSPATNSKNDILDNQTVAEVVPSKSDSTLKVPALEELPNETLISENNESDATTEPNDASTDQGSTLIFNIEDFDVKTAVTKAYDVAEDTKKSGFKKVLDFVKSVKEGEAGLGGLREAKNNLLSIKQKDQKDKEDENSR